MKQLVLLGLIFLFTLGWAIGQEDQGQQPVFRSQVDVVNVLFTVRWGDSYVTNLTREDFEVRENGILQEIQFFNREGDEDAQPLSIVLLIDTSGSVKDKLRFEQEAASFFLEETLRKNRDMAAVVQFDSEINLVQDFTYDAGLLNHSIDQIRAGGATKLYDAIWVSVNDLLRHEVGRRVLVVLSDGEDTQSIVSDDDAIKIAQDHDVMIFGIGVRSGRFGSNFGKLKSFAEDTGGLFFDSRARLDELQRAFARINEAIKNQYSIGYVSTNQARDGTFREIEIEARGRGLKVMHRKGYYAEGGGS
ncbi:MAG TPA: VWA domain-containing protein [Acidobacteriota bacterium]|nr:VWA domain-containing protein [Acidobacteriota bacterium]